MTVQELEQVLKNVDAAQLAAFLQRGQLLTARDAIDSQIRNAEKARDEAYNDANAAIGELQAKRDAIAAQIDAL